MKLLEICLYNCIQGDVFSDNARIGETDWLDCFYF